MITVEPVTPHYGIKHVIVHRARVPMGPVFTEAIAIMPAAPTLLPCAIRIGIHAGGDVPPISLMVMGRLATDRLIVPGQDKIFLALPCVAATRICGPSPPGRRTDHHRIVHVSHMQSQELAQTR